MAKEGVAGALKAETARDTGRKLPRPFSPECLRDQGHFVMSQLASAGICTWMVRPLPGSSWEHLRQGSRPKDLPARFRGALQDMHY